MNLQSGELLKAVYCHLKVFIFAVGANERVNQRLDFFDGRSRTAPLFSLWLLH
jgi:hypothetical protein